MAQRIAGGRALERRSRYTRTWQNVGTNGGGGLLENTPGGWLGGPPGSERPLAWQGSDNLGALLAAGGGGYRRFTRDGIVYTYPDGARDPLALPTVGRATGLIVDTLGGLPMRLHRGDETLDPPRWVSDPQMLRPDDRVMALAGQVAPLGAVAFWTQVLTSQVWYGVGYVWCPSRAADGSPRPPLYVLNPLDVTVRQVPADGKPAGVWVDDAEGGPYRFADGEVLVLPGAGPYVGGIGTGVLARYAGTLLTAEVMGSYTRDVFGAGVPAGYLKSSAPNMTETQATDLKTKWMEAHGGGNARGIAVLNSVTEFHPIAFSPVDAALVEAGVVNAQQVALAFGVSPYMLGLPSGSETYANIEDRHTEFVTWSLMPWVRRLEDHLSAEFPYGTDLRIDLRGLLRAAQADRVATYSAALADGWMTIEEVRRLEDLGPLPPEAVAAQEAKTAATLALVENLNADTQQQQGTEPPPAEEQTA